MKRSVAACVPRVHVPSVEEQVFQVLNHPVSTNLYKCYDNCDDEEDDDHDDDDDGDDDDVEEQVFQVLHHPISTNLAKFYEVDGDDDEVDDNGNDVHVCSINAEPFRFNRPFFP